MSAPRAEPEKIRNLQKITDATLATLRAVSMGQFAVVKCKEEDNIYLYTSALGPCIGIVAECKDKEGNKVLGAAHMVHMDANDFFPGAALEVFGKLFTLRARPYQIGELDEIVAKFQPSLLNQMLNAMKLIAGGDQIIDVYFGGGRAGVADKEVQVLLTEYVKKRSDLRLVDTRFNPYKFTKDESECGLTDKILGELGAAFGITSKGAVLSTVDIDIDIGRFNTDEAVTKYLAEKEISLPLQDRVDGFDFATYLETLGNGCQFTLDVIRGSCEYESDKLSAVKAVLKEGSSPIFKSAEKKEVPTVEPAAASALKQKKE